MAASVLHRSSPPAYTARDVELNHLDSTTSPAPSILSAPPPYDDEAPSSTVPFHPTATLQIETRGKSWCSLPLPLRPDPIPIFTLDTDPRSAAELSRAPTFTSFRPDRGSGSCYLLPSSDAPAASSSSSGGTLPVLSTTTYRFGPSRPPRVRLFSPHSYSGALRGGIPRPVLDELLFPSSHSDADDQDVLDYGIRPWDSFTITSVGLLTRAVRFRTRLGTFQWRYAGRREREALSVSVQGNMDVASLLVLERVVRVAHAHAHAHHAAAGGKSRSRDKEKEEEVRTVVAQFVRGAGTRTEGSGRSSAGNGGRLLMDLGLWGEEAATSGGGGKEEREMAAVMVVTTCLVMLKREVDRRRAQQIAIMAGVVGGGGS